MSVGRAALETSSRNVSKRVGARESDGDPVVSLGAPSDKSGTHDHTAHRPPLDATTNRRLQPAAERAEDWLRADLSARPAPCPSASIRAAAQADGIAPRTLQRAARSIGVVVEDRRGPPGPPRQTFWSLPPDVGATTSAIEPAFTGPQRPADSRYRFGSLADQARRIREGRRSPTTERTHHD
jgi:hypothetical protein